MASLQQEVHPYLLGDPSRQDQGGCWTLLRVPVDGGQGDQGGRHCPLPRWLRSLPRRRCHRRVLVSARRAIAPPPSGEVAWREDRPRRHERGPAELDRRNRNDQQRHPVPRRDRKSDRWTTGNSCAHLHGRDRGGPGGFRHGEPPRGVPRSQLGADRTWQGLRHLRGGRRACRQAIHDRHGSPRHSRHQQRQEDIAGRGAEEGARQRCSRGSDHAVHGLRPRGVGRTRAERSGSDHCLGGRSAHSPRFGRNAAHRVLSISSQLQASEILREAGRGDSMQDELLRILEERLAADKSDRQDWSLYVLAACEGEATLNDVLGSAATAGRQRTAFAAAPITHEPVGAYLKSIEVEGFRGVGPARRLELAPGPGLTLVVGRNGSGKSSFAEALEILLTGANWRWKDRSAVWREGWRNLHHPSPTRVGAEIAVEGTPGITTATRAWPDGTDLAAGIATVRKPGGKPADLDALGWAGPLETYRPFLSYNELGSMLEAGPTELHDRLSNILGLADLERAQQVLKDARLPREKGLAGVSKRLTPLMTRLEGLPDERAKRARQAFGGKKWDLDAAEGALGSATDAAGADELAILRALAGLVVPSVEEALGLAEELESLDARRKALAATPAGQAHQIAGLLRSAMDWHGAHGDGDCPVCGRTAAMDDAWRENAQKRITELDELVGGGHELEVEARRAADRTSRLTAAPPAILDRAREVGLDSTPLDRKSGRVGKEGR